MMVSLLQEHSQAVSKPQPGLHVLYIPCVPGCHLHWGADTTTTCPRADYEADTFDSALCHPEVELSVRLCAAA